MKSIFFRYISCILAQHNFGLAAMSKGLRFKTRCWAYNDEDMMMYNKQRQAKNFNETPIHKTSIETTISYDLLRSCSPMNQTLSVDNEKRQRRKSSAPKLLLAPPTSSWRHSRRVKVFKKHEKDNMEKVAEEDELNSLVSSKTSITSNDYQIN